MPPDIQESPKTWRQNPFVVHVLFELPIIGNLLKHEILAEGLHEAGKCTAMLAGGTTAMMTILVPTEEDSMAVKMAKMSSSMAIGMTAGKVAYNGMTFLYQCLASKAKAFAYHQVSNESTSEQGQHGIIVGGHGDPPLRAVQPDI